MSSDQGVIGHPEKAAIAQILSELFESGARWIRTIQQHDWRHERYMSNRKNRVLEADWPPSADFAQIASSVAAYVRKAPTADTAQEHIYFIAKPDKACNSDKGIAIIRPVLKKNTEGTPTLNFHVWFHMRQPAGAGHLVHGWRLEAPEQDASEHNFYHAQPLTKYGRGEKPYGLNSLQSDKFPTIPLLASNPVELCLCAVMLACGKPGVSELARSRDPTVREAARNYLDKLALKA